MKKQVLFLIFSLIIFLCPVKVFASDGETDTLLIKIQIQEDGSVDVEELASLEGSYNGRLRNIDFRNSNIKSFNGEADDLEGSSIYNGSGISNVLVTDYSSKNISFASFEDISKKGIAYKRVQTGYNGQSGVYEEVLGEDGISLKIFNPSTTNKSFYLSYHIDDVVVVHNDIAEFAWNILGNNYEDNIDKLSVRILLPTADNDVRVFLHGPLNGEIKRLEDGKGAEISYDFLGARNAVSTRIVFNKSVVPKVTKKSNMNAFDTILGIEKKLADKANKEREKIRAQNNLIIFSSVFWYLALVVVLILFLRYQKKNNRCEFEQEYLRELPFDYGPEILEYLLKSSVSPTGMSASLLLLIEKKALKVEKLEGEKEDYILKKNEKHDLLTEAEEQLLNLFLLKVGNGEEVTLKQIKEAGKKVTKARSFIKGYERWQRLTVKNTKKEDFFSKNITLQTLGVFVSLLGFLITIANATAETGFILGYLAIIFGFVGMIYFATRKIRTKNGVLHYKKWMAFKKFLLDFGTLDEKELPEVAIWGKYLVYATVLGCANQLQEQMKIRMENMSDSVDLVNYYGYNTYFTVMNSFSYTVSNSVSQAVASSRASIASSSSSSASGFGGGASGGGGSFGGGGGGGHF